MLNVKLYFSLLGSLSQILNIYKNLILIQMMPVFGDLNGVTQYGYHMVLNAQLG